VVSYPRREEHPLSANGTFKVVTISRRRRWGAGSSKKGAATARVGEGWGKKIGKTPQTWRRGKYNGKPLGERIEGELGVVLESVRSKS